MSCFLLNRAPVRHGDLVFWTVIADWLTYNCTQFPKSPWRKNFVNQEQSYSSNGQYSGLKTSIMSCFLLNWAPVRHGDLVFWTVIADWLTYNCTQFPKSPWRKNFVNQEQSYSSNGQYSGLKTSIMSCFLLNWAPVRHGDLVFWTAHADWLT